MRFILEESYLRMDSIEIKQEVSGVKKNRKKVYKKSLSIRLPKTFLLISSLVVGVLTGFVGSIFQLSIKWLIIAKEYIATVYLKNELFEWIFLIAFSVISILLSVWLVKRYAPSAAGSGVQEVEGVLSNKRMLHWKRIIPVKFFGGILSLSAGLVMGREGPTIHLGSAIGKMLSLRFRLKPEFTNTLVAAGAGAGLAAAFNAPLAGILFVIEEMRSTFKFSFWAKRCVIIASISSVVVLRLIVGPNPDITMTFFSDTPTEYLWVFVIFGSLFGVMGLVFNKCLIYFLDFFSNLKPKTYWVVVFFVAVGVGVLTKVYPDIIGGGYQLIPQTLRYTIPASILVLIFIMRLGTTWVSYGLGAPGGIFAPMLALGTTFGVMFGYFINICLPWLDIDPGIFAVAGMSALFAATVGAPITGIVLVAEMTMNYSLILPLITTCFCATIVSHLLGNHHIYELLLKRTLAMERKKRDKNIQKYSDLINKDDE